MTVKVTRRVDGSGTTRTGNAFTIRTDSDGIAIDEARLFSAADLTEFTEHLNAAIDDRSRILNGRRNWKPAKPTAKPCDWLQLETKQ